MSSSNKRQLSHVSSILSQSFDSLDFGEEEKYLYSDKHSEKPKENQDPQKENPLKPDHSECFSQFTHELSKFLSLRLPANSMDSLKKAIQSSIKSLISCSVLELKNTIDQCYKAISLFEDYGQTTSNLYLGSFIFTLNITDKDLAPGSKSEISKNFASFSVVQEEPADSFTDFRQDLDKSLSQAFKDSFSYSYITEVSSSAFYRFSFIKEIEDFNYRKRNIETYSIKKELEWEKHEIKTLKGQIKSKHNDLLYREKQLKEESSKISLDRVRLTKEKDLLEAEQEKLDTQKARFFKIQEIIRDLSSHKRLEINTSQLSNSSFASADPGEVLEDEQKTLEKERDELKQALFKSSPERQNSLTMQINKIENRISSIKSERLLNSNKKRSLKMNTVVSKIQNSMSIKPNLIPRLPLTTSQLSLVPQITSQARKSTYTPLSSQLTHHARSPTYAPSGPLTPSSNRSNNTPIDEPVDSNVHKKSESFFPSDFRYSSLETEEKDESCEAKLRSLVLREARLQQKEEEIIKKENAIKANIDRRVTDKDVLEIIRTERMGINRKTKEVEARERKLEELFREAEKFEVRVRNRNKELDRVQFEMENERSSFEAEKDEWYSRYEDIQKVIAENLNI